MGKLNPWLNQLLLFKSSSKGAHMKIKPPQLKISDENPFQEDVLDRKQSADILTQFVGSITEPFVLAIDSPWGTGKTTFLQMWAKVLRKHGYKHIAFNAWQNDFSDSPLVSLIAEVGSSLKHMGLDGVEMNGAQKAYEATKKIGASLIKTMIPIAVKLGTAGVLEAADLKPSEFSHVAEEWAKKQIEKHEKAKGTIEDFKKSLVTFVSTINNHKKGEDAKPVIFIIDEMDRCRPDYAVALLEKLKHLFNIPGLVFVLALDIQQLGESVKSVYGAGINAKEYLKRFIDLHYHLPEPKTANFVDAMFARFGLNEVLEAKTGSSKHDGDYLKECLSNLFTFFDFSLRTQEQCMTQVSVILLTTAPNDLIYSPLLALLLCLRIDQKSLYVDYAEGRATVDDILAYFKSAKSKGVLPADFSHILEAHLVYGIRDDKKRQAIVKRYKDLAASEKAGNSPPGQASPVVDCFDWLRLRGDITGYLYKKIELAQQFTR
jgi:hypothetical protein